MSFKDLHHLSQSRLPGGVSWFALPWTRTRARTHTHTHTHKLTYYRFLLRIVQFVANCLGVFLSSRLHQTIGQKPVAAYQKLMPFDNVLFVILIAVQVCRVFWCVLVFEDSCDTLHDSDAVGVKPSVGARFPKVPH